MDYQELKPDQQRGMLVQQIHGLEQQHWLQVLTKIAQGKDAASQVDDAIRKLEQGITALRDKLREHDMTHGTSSPTDPAVPPQKGLS